MRIFTIFFINLCLLTALKGQETHHVLVAIDQPVSCSVLGNNLENSIRIYPVPADQYVIVKSSDIISQLVLLELSGKGIRRFNPGLDATRMEVSDLKEGMYLLQVHIASAVFYFKILINHH